MKRIKAMWKAFCHPELLEIRDPWTGAMTRKEFIRIVARILNRARRTRQKVCLAMLDVDGLKAINDTQGYKSGDAIIKEFAEAIFANIRPLDLCARWHGDAGDEFVLLLDANFIDSMRIIRRIQAAFPSFSWGITEASMDREYVLTNMILHAEKSLHRHKERKR